MALFLPLAHKDIHMNTPSPHQDTPIKGIIFACLAFFSFSAMGMFTKLLTGQHHAVEVVFYRNLLGLVALGAYILLSKRHALLKTDQPWLMGWRAFIGTTGLFFTLSAMQILPMSYATTLFFVSTLITPVLAVILLKETLGIHRISAIIIGFCGVLLVAQPSGVAPWIGIGAALIAGCCHSMVQITLRALKSQPAQTVTFYFFLGGVLMPLPFMPFVAHMPTWETAFPLLMVGVTGCIGQFFLTWAFQHAPASLVSPFNYTGLVWAIVFDISIWGIAPDHVVLSGAALIIGASLYIIYRERQANKALATKTTAIESASP